jgi:hypothetical protein
MRTRRLLACALAPSCLLILAASGAAATKVNLRGTWRCCGSGGAGAQTWKITSTGTSGSIAGSGGGGSYTFPIKGRVTGHTVTLTTGPYAQLPSYSATFKGTVSARSRSMSGTWTSNVGQSGTWTAVLKSRPKGKRSHGHHKKHHKTHHKHKK